MPDPAVERLRAQISAADAELVAVLNRRLRAVSELHAHKREHGYHVRDPAREEQVMRDALAANAGPISDDALAEIYRLLLPLLTREAARA
jgi:chorismate mutase